MPEMVAKEKQLRIQYHGTLPIRGTGPIQGIIQYVTWQGRVLKETRQGLCHREKNS